MGFAGTQSGGVGCGGRGEGAGEDLGARSDQTGSCPGRTEHR